MTSTGMISLYVDTLLVEAILADPHFYKKAGFIGDLLSKVKGYFDSKIDREHPTTSVLNELAPGAIWMLFNSLGLGMWGTLVSLLMSVFHVNVMGILTSLYEKVKDWISGGKVTPEQVDQGVQQVASAYSQESSPQEVQEGYQALQQMQPQQSSPADDGKVYSSLELLQEARVIRLALIEYDRQNFRLTKTAAGLSDFERLFSTRKATGTNLIAKIFGWVIKLAFISAGFMLAGDTINALFGRPSSLTGTYQAGQPEGTPAPSASHVTQTKYPLKGDAPIPDTMPLPNTPQNVENMIIQFAKDVYSGLDGKESLIRNTPGFQVIKNKINWANVYNPGSQSIIIPPAFTTKKQLVDLFIDDVAAQDKA